VKAVSNGDLLSQVLVWLVWLWGEFLSLASAIRETLPFLTPENALPAILALTVLNAVLLLIRRPRVGFKKVPRNKLLQRAGTRVWSWVRPRLTWGLAVRLLRLGGLTVFSIIVFAVAYALVAFTIFFFLLGVLGLNQRNWPAYALIALITAYAVFAWKQVKRIVARGQPAHSSDRFEDSDLRGWFGA